MIAVARREVELMPRLLQNVLVLRDLEELSITEVAERLRISVPATKSRLLRARQELRKRLIAYYRNGRCVAEGIQIQRRAQCIKSVSSPGAADLAQGPRNPCGSPISL